MCTYCRLYYTYSTWGTESFLNLWISLVLENSQLLSHWTLLLFVLALLTAQDSNYANVRPSHHILFVSYLSWIFHSCIFTYFLQDIFFWPFFQFTILSSDVITCCWTYQLSFLNFHLYFSVIQFLFGSIFRNFNSLPNFSNLSFLSLNIINIIFKAVSGNSKIWCPHGSIFTVCCFFRFCSHYLLTHLVIFDMRQKLFSQNCL